MTIDEFRANNDICQIDLLKIDTERHELEVLHGVRQRPSESAMRYVPTEVTLLPSCGVHRQIAFCDVAGFIADLDFECAGLYDQLSWADGGIYDGNALLRNVRAKAST